MRALTVIPGVASTMALEDRADPQPGRGEMLARSLAVGICGTDHEIAQGSFGWAPENRQRLVIGHESLAEIVEAPRGCGFVPGDLIVGIVRRPDPVPCPSCAVGEWDMCRNGLYTERGIKSLDGFCADYFTVEPAFAVKLAPDLRRNGVLLEPASIIAKAWDQIRRIGARAQWSPRTVLVTGAGPVGLLAALFATQLGLEVHVFDQVATGPKPDLVRDLGAVYHSGSLDDLGLQPDVIVECTGASALIVKSMEILQPAGILCLAGLSGDGRAIEIDSNLLGRIPVLGNHVVVGTVNANRTHYQLAADALARADEDWLARLITRRVPLAQWQAAFERRPGDVKTVLDFS